jgi:membrane protein DedA with SNARE-associated domain
MRTLEYQRARFTKKISIVRCVVATIVALFAWPILWFLIGEILVEPITNHNGTEQEPLTTILLVADVVLSLALSALVFMAIAFDGKRKRNRVSVK